MKLNLLNSVIDKYKSVIRWAMMLVMIAMLVLVAYSINKTNSILEKYAKSDFSNRQVSRAIMQIRAHIPKANQYCFEYINNSKPEFYDNCFTAIEAGMAQVSKGLDYDMSLIQEELDVLYTYYEEIEGLKTKEDKERQRIKILNKSTEIFDSLGVIESDFWSSISGRYSTLVSDFNYLNKLSYASIIFVMIVTIFLLVLMVRKDLADDKLKEANDQLEQQKILLIHSGKMSTLGEMASGVAHEINNPLAIAQSKASQMLRAYKTNLNWDLDKKVDALQKIIDMTERISKIIKGLRSFARDGENDPFQSTSLNQIIFETLELCQTRLKNHSIELQYTPNLEDIIIECRATQISQVVLNLIHNSADEIEKLSTKWIKIEVFDRDSFVEVAIVDSGKGIPLGNQEKIFQPFFTTKDVGKGTGLGLSISRGIIQAHHGQLAVDNDSRNTRIYFQIPKKQKG